MTDVFQSVRRDKGGAVAMLRELSDINVRHDGGENLLHTAIAYGNMAAVNELLAMGIDLNAQDHKGMTPLHYAAAHNNPAAVELILDHGGRADVTDRHGNSALWTAVVNARGHYEVVAALVERGAVRLADTKNIHGRSPMDFALQIGDVSLQELLSM